MKLKLIVSFFKSKLTFIKYSTTIFLGIPFSLLTGFLTLRNIDPLLMGIWNSVLLFQSYMLFFGLGIVNGMNRELPFQLGCGNEELAIKYASNTLFHSALQMLFYCLVLFIVILFSNGEYYYKISIIVLFLKLILNTYARFLNGTYRSSKDFLILSKVQLYTLLVKLLLAPLILISFEFFLIYQLLIDLLNSLFLHIWRPLKAKIEFSGIVYKNLLKTGLPIFSSSYFSGLIDTMPSILILNFAGIKELGVYAPVAILLSFTSQITDSFQTYVYPKYLYEYGKNNNRKVIFNSNLKIIAIIFISLIILSFIFLFLIPYFKLAFPKYKESEKYFYQALLVVPVIFYRFSITLIVVFKKYKNLFSFQIVRLFLFISFFYIINNTIDEVISSVLYAMALTYFLMILFGFYLGFRISKT